ncbi:MAG: hypothetical protein KDN18_25635 [Verrucomicrobiae bacterium]|nr:hypothetical protein [Verrucomicrobiae bacterium]
MHEVYTGMVREFEFHGMVVDNEDRPIAGVNVGAELYTYSLFRGKNYRKFVIATDRDGRFSVGPGKAISLKLYPIEKSGYKVRGRKWPNDGGDYWPYNFSSPSYKGVIASQTVPFTFVMDPTTDP